MLDPDRPKMSSMDRPRVLFLINSLTGGGAERIMSILLANSRHKAAEFDIHLALLDRETGVYPIPDWVTVHQLDCRFSLARSFPQFRRLIELLEPAVTVSFLTRANVANCLAMPRTGRPAIISERINTDVQLGGGLRGLITRGIVRHAYPKASRVIAVARGIGDTLVRSYGVSASKIDVIPNPVDIDAIRAWGSEPCAGVPEGPFVFAMGRLVPNKNFPLLLRAFAKAGVPGRLVIAGEGPERASLIALAEELGLADRLVLPGFLANPHAVLAHARTFVLSSNAEGFPNSLIEALTLGISAVATNCADGPAEILAGVTRQEVTGTRETPAGILVPTNDVDALAAALRRLEDPGLRQSLVDGGRKLAENYSVATSVSRYWEIIERELAYVRAEPA